MNDYSLKNTDFIYNKVGNKVTSLGFKVNNSLLGIKPAMIGGGFKKEGDNTTLAVPAILAKFHNLVQENSNTLKKVGADQSEVVDNNLYDKLLDLMNPKPKKAYKGNKKKHTRKKIKHAKRNGKRKRKTRKK
jgi:hypothetical protein